MHAYIHTYILTLTYVVSTYICFTDLTPEQCTHAYYMHTYIRTYTTPLQIATEKDTQIHTRMHINPIHIPPVQGCEGVAKTRANKHLWPQHRDSKILATLPIP